MKKLVLLLALVLSSCSKIGEGINNAIMEIPSGESYMVNIHTMAEEDCRLVIVANGDTVREDTCWTLQETGSSRPGNTYRLTSFKTIGWCEVQIIVSDLSGERETVTECLFARECDFLGYVSYLHTVQQVAEFCGEGKRCF